MGDHADGSSSHRPGNSLFRIPWLCSEIPELDLALRSGERAIAFSLADLYCDEARGPLGVFGVIGVPFGFVSLRGDQFIAIGDREDAEGSPDESAERGECSGLISSARKMTWMSFRAGEQ